MVRTCLNSIASERHGHNMCMTFTNSNGIFNERGPVTKEKKNDLVTGHMTIDETQINVPTPF